MTANEIIRRFDELPRVVYPPHGQPVVVNGDAWAGHLVVKAVDVAHLLSWLLERVEGEVRA